MQNPFEFVRVEMDHGLRAEVLASCDPAARSICARALGPRFAGGLPNVRDWVEPLSLLALDPENIPHREVLKHSHTTEVLRVGLSMPQGTVQVVSKRWLRDGGWRNRLLRHFGSPAQKNLSRALALLRADVNTALPLAKLVKRTHPRMEWLILEAIDDAVDLDQFVLTELPLLDPQVRLARVRAIVPPLIDTLLQLERNHLYHRDLKASNWMLAGWQSADPRCCLVDLDGLQLGKTATRARRRQQIVRLVASLLEYDAVTRTDYLRALRIYLAGADEPRESWKAWYRELGCAAAEYVKAAKMRKRHKLDGYS